MRFISKIKRIVKKTLKNFEKNIENKKKHGKKRKKTVKNTVFSCFRCFFFKLKLFFFFQYVLFSK